MGAPATWSLHGCLLSARSSKMLEALAICCGPRSCSGNSRRSSVASARRSKLRWQEVEVEGLDRRERRRPLLTPNRLVERKLQRTRRIGRILVAFCSEVLLVVFRHFFGFKVPAADVSESVSQMLSSPV